MLPIIILHTYLRIQLKGEIGTQTWARFEAVSKESSHKLVGSFMCDEVHKTVGTDYHSRWLCENPNQEK